MRADTAKYFHWDKATLRIECCKLAQMNEELFEALEACLDWIDAVPDDAQLPTMPGFDRDWVDSIRANAKGGTHE